MPISDYRNIPAVLKAFVNCRPVAENKDWPIRVLDVGCGFGKYGVIFRESQDLMFQRYEKAIWQSRIDAVEIWQRWLTPLHYYIYDNIFVEDFAYTVDRYANYDVVFIGDMIEHLTKEEGRRVIAACLEKNLNVILCIPDSSQKLIADSPTLGGGSAYLDNPYEVHKSRWYREDFPDGQFFSEDGALCMVVRLFGKPVLSQGQP